jgi:hypothetical protein
MQRISARTSRYGLEYRQWRTTGHLRNLRHARKRHCAAQRVGRPLRQYWRFNHHRRLRRGGGRKDRASAKLVFVNAKNRVIELENTVAEQELF